MISASHNPFEDNGIKVFGRTGFKLPDAEEHDVEQEIFRIVSEVEPAPAPEPLAESWTGKTVSELSASTAAENTARRASRGSLIAETGARIGARTRSVPDRRRST